MKSFNAAVPVLMISLAAVSFAQSDKPRENTEPTLKINSRAVLVDVVVSDKNGNPVKGLKQSDFTVLEDGKPQSLSFFEEHTAEDLARRSQKLEFPSLPPNFPLDFQAIIYPDVGMSNESIILANQRLAPISLQASCGRVWPHQDDAYVPR